eukprot:TRINITY_DN26871_c0_g2_i2.p1 TRINITY_DN26871_c0_g2~~TRINITY_DN26871_c0_g2_i2.p1  ORF type:complete len:383 (+),score=85.49 TRINITY_DN26871_c0_g2_i2:206-1354(+)
MLFAKPTQGDGERTAELHIQDASGRAFLELLRCAHDLEPEISEENFIDVFRVARKFDVQELHEAIALWMLEATRFPPLALRALDAAHARERGAAEGSEKVVDEEELEEMLEACLHTVTLHFESLLEERALEGISARTLELLVRRSDLNCDEERLWLALVAWEERNKTPVAEGEDSVLRRLAPYLRFNVMSPEFFVDRVVPSGILEPAQVVGLLSARATARPAAGFPEAHLQRGAVLRARQWDVVRDEDSETDSATEVVPSMQQRLAPGSSSDLSDGNGPSGSVAGASRDAAGVSREGSGRDSGLAAGGRQGSGAGLGIDPRLFVAAAAAASTGDVAAGRANALNSARNVAKTSHRRSHADGSGGSVPAVARRSRGDVSAKGR